MQSALQFEMTLLAGARRLLEAHARTLPQRDDLCGAFCGALALHAARIDTCDGEQIDQDAVALAAGSLVSAMPETHNLPLGERSRRDYRLALPRIGDAAVSGTTPAGLVRAVERLSGGALAAVPCTASWSADVRAADRLPARRHADGPGRGLGRRALRLPRRARRWSRRDPVRGRRHLPLARHAGRTRATGRAAGARPATAGHGRGGAD